MTASFRCALCETPAGTVRIVPVEQIGDDSALKWGGPLKLIAENMTGRALLDADPDGVWGAHRRRP